MPKEATNTSSPATDELVRVDNPGEQIPPAAEPAATDQQNTIDYDPEKGTDTFHSEDNNELNALGDTPDFARNDFQQQDGTGANNQESNATPENNQPPAAREAPPDLIAGKFKSQDDLITAYKGLEQKLHQPNPDIRQLRQIQRDMEILQKENTRLSGIVKENDNVDPTDFNNQIAEDPATAIETRIQTAVEAALRKRDDQDVRRRGEEAVENMKDDINRNIYSMQNHEVYGERFANNRKPFAQYLRDMHMDSGKILADKVKFEQAYKGFIAVHDVQSFADEQREAGQVEALDKHGQMPPVENNNRPPPKPNDNGLSMTAGPQTTPGSNGEVAPAIDPLNEMETRMGIGMLEQPRMWS